MRHTQAGLAIPDFPLSYGRLVPGFDSASIEAINLERRWGETWYPQVTANQVMIHYLHRVGALLATLAVLVTTIAVWRTCRKDRWLRRPAGVTSAIRDRACTQHSVRRTLRPVSRGAGLRGRLIFSA